MKELCCKQFLIRADGRKTLGMGHLNRAHLLANYISDIAGFEACLVSQYCKEAESFLANRPIKYDLVWVGAGQELGDGNAAIEKIHRTREIHSIILDLLEDELTDTYLKFLKGFERPIAAIVDVSGFYDLNVDLIINGNPNQLGIQYCSNTRHLSGPKYFIMDEKYGLSVNRVWQDKSSNILLCLGGTDHNNIVFKILDALSHFKHIKLKIVTSMATGYIPRLKKFCIDSALNFDMAVDLNSLVDEWGKVDFAITAGGNLLFERIASGTPGVTICQLSRQMEIANFFSNNGGNINLGYGPELSVDKLIEEFDKLLNSGLWKKSQIKSSKLLVPGNGLEKCVDAILKLGV
jgi:spore coat polysaccharide biosynthesis predicted glycosyltransferase SpsG